MIFKVKGQSYIKMHFNHHMVQNIGPGALASSCTTTRSTMGTNVRITFKVKGQGHKVNELKPLSYKLLVVGS